MLSDAVDTFTVLSVKVHLTCMAKVLAIMDEWVETDGRCRSIIATGMHGIMEGKRDSNFKNILNSADLFVPDGYSLVLTARLRGFDIKDRISGPDLMWESCKHASQTNQSVFFYGDTIETLDVLSDRLLTYFPTLKIAGVHSPPFRVLTQEEEERELELINSSGADILWVGLGLPKQEQWIARHRDKLNVSVAIGVGAAFKFLSGRLKRAPSCIRDNGFEWLWRFIFEPRRVWRRVIIDGPTFIICVLKESFSSRDRL